MLNDFPLSLDSSFIKASHNFLETNEMNHIATAKTTNVHPAEIEDWLLVVVPAVRSSTPPTPKIAPSPKPTAFIEKTVGFPV